MTDDLIRRILTNTKTVALVGASPKPERSANFVMKFLQDTGYRVIPVNPEQAGNKIHDETVVSDLRYITVPFQMVDIFRASDAVPAIVETAVEMMDRHGITSIWMQQGVFHEAAAQTARDAGLDVIMDRCPKIEHPRLIHQ